MDIVVVSVRFSLELPVETWISGDSNPSNQAGHVAQSVAHCGELREHSRK